MCLQKRFPHVLGNLIFGPKVSILHGLQPLHCGHFWPFSKCSNFSDISCFFVPFFAQNNFNVFVETLSACFRQFYFLTQTEYFVRAIAFVLWPFTKCAHFSNISCFLEPSFAQNKLNVFLETFFESFKQFYFLTQSKYFALAIAFALWPFLAIFKILSFFEELAVFSKSFLHRTTLKCLQKRFPHLLSNIFLTQTEYFAGAIAFVLWTFLAIFKMLSFLEYQLFLRTVLCIEQL